MTDVFISFAREDQLIAKALAVQLQAAGHNVWWDAQLLSGSAYAFEIQRQLDQARAVVVIWTPHSIASTWVYDEASRAHRMGKIVPVCHDISSDGLPPPFSSIHTIHLNDQHALLHSIARKPPVKAA